MKKIEVSVKQAENEEPIPVEIIAKSIKKIADAYKRMKSAGLSERCIVLLLHDYSHVGKPDIKDVLKAMSELEKMYLSK